MGVGVRFVSGVGVGEGARAGEDVGSGVTVTEVFEVGASDVARVADWAALDPDVGRDPVIDPPPTSRASQPTPNPTAAARTRRATTAKAPPPGRFGFERGRSRRDMMAMLVAGLLVWACGCRYDVVVQGSFAVDALRNSRLFAGSGPESLAAISRTLRSRHFRRGEVLFHEGDPGDSLFIVVSGSVKVVIPSDQGGEAILATLGRGESLGELSLFDGVARSASAIAIEPVEALMLPRQQFLSLLATDAGLRNAVLEHLAAELRRLTTHVAELHFLDLTGRLAARLVRLADERGERTVDGSIRLDRPSQRDLAAMVGSTRQSVNKLITEFAQEGLVRLEPDALVIPDMDRLRAHSHR